MTKSIRIIALITLAGMAHADAADITVRGAPTCAEYLTAKQKAREGNTDDAFNDLTWFLGYMSGLAVGTHSDILKAGDNGRSMTEWLDLYCQRNPGRYLSDAGDLFYGFLRERSGWKKTAMPARTVQASPC